MVILQSAMVMRHELHVCMFNMFSANCICKPAKLPSAEHLFGWAYSRIGEIALLPPFVMSTRKNHLACKIPQVR